MNMMRRHLILVAVISLSMFLASCGSSYDSNGNGGASSGASTTDGATNTGVKAGIVMKDIKFDPGRITVAAGTPVTWTNDESVQHNVTSKDGLFTSGNLIKGESFSYTFDQPGTYEYECTLHPPNMKGTVVVE